MTQPAKAQEPSMEEILASIRRIIADDDGGKAPPPRAPDPAMPVAPAPETPARPVAVAPRPAPQPMPPRPGPPPQPAARQNQVESVLGEPDPVRVTAPQKPRTEVLELTESMVTAAPPEVGSLQDADSDTDLVFDDGSDEPAPRPQPAEMAEPKSVAKPEQERDQRLVSSATSAAVDSAFDTLAHTVLAQNARTLEDLVKEMLRPMLQSWLDDNLPGLVERLVRAEIERVSRGRA
jgi:cell pole-organizing protein PopZ